MTWPDLDDASPELRSLLRRIDHPRASPRRKRELCHQALALLRWDQRRLWVLLQIELGSDWIEDPDADPIEKVERAIHAYETALAFPDLTPKARTAAHSNLGFCYLHRLRGLRTRNLDASVSHLEGALAILDPDEDPELWEITTAYLDEACAAQDQGSADAAVHLRDLGAVFLERAEGDRAHNLEVAFRLFRRALRIHTPEEEDEERASLWNNLGTTFLQRLRGDRAENVERAIEAYGKALKICTRKDSPMSWAEAQTNLGSAYSQRILGDAADNGEKAITAYRQALRVLTQRKTPSRWARVTMNLGNALSEPFLQDRAEKLEAAIACYKGALRVFSQKDDPYEWATAQDNLGSAYADRLRGNPKKNRTLALAAHRAALPVWARLRARWEWARTHNSLGTIFAEPPGGVPPNRRRAARSFHQALRVFTVDLAPNQHRRTQRNLGDLWFAARRWKAAGEAYAGALRAGELLFHSGITPASRDAKLRESLDLPIRAAYCLARQGRADEALTVLEQGRTRTLAEALDRREAAIDRLPAADRQAFEIARNEVHRLEAQARSLDVNDPELLRISETLGIARKSLAQKLSSTAPGVLPPPLNAAEIENLSRRLDSPLIYLLTTRHGSLALIQPPYDPASALFLNGFTSDEAGKIEIGGAGGREETIRALDDAWPVWRERLMLPLARRLRRLGFEQAVLIPCGRLALWPLPATVMDHLRLTLAPSARLLLTARVNAEARRSQSPSLLAVAHPGAGNRFLPSAEIEAERIAAGLDHAHILRGTEATREAVAQALPGVTHLHFACHGSFHSGEPLDSSLELAGPSPLTLRDLLDGDLNLSSARLAVLSACDSGRIENRYLPDEALGFPTGFLQAGIPTVVSGLWEVDDLAATHLLSELYTAHLQRGLPLLDALLAAQGRLRTATNRELGLTEHCREILSRPLPPHLRAAFYLRRRRAESHPEEVPFRHPFYWGAFVVAGVG